MVGRKQSLDKAFFNCSLTLYAGQKEFGAMLRGVGNAIVVLVAASLVDKYFNNSVYMDAAFSMLHQIRHSFQW